MRNEAHLRSVCKWIIDLETSIHMTSHRAAFATHEVIAPHNVHLDDNSLVKTIEIEFIFVKIIMECKINRIHIKYVLYEPKLHVNLLSVNKIVL